MEDTKTRCGYATIIGKPNAGKSTLLNAILGQKLVITNPKPQTTRKKILGILDEPAYQVIFIDTPGIIEPRYLLQEKMMQFVHRSIGDADVALCMIDTSQQQELDEILSEEFIEKYPQLKNRPIILILNKIDLVQQAAVLDIIARAEKLNRFTRIIPASALEKFNIPEIIDTVVSYMPEHPKYYPEGIISDEIERYFVAEIIREKILDLYQDEIPYSCEVVVEEFNEREESKHFIGALIYVERDTQKSIIIGKGGTSIKRLGEYARKAVEEFLDHQVYLELRVKVAEKWRRDSRALRNFGYDPNEE